MVERKFHCENCGANVVFEPNAQSLICPYCGTEKAIPQSEAQVIEHDLGEALNKGFSNAPTVEARTVTCPTCAATTRFDAHVTASRCAFCDAPLTSSPRKASVLAPQAILPFGVEAKAAEESFSRWLGARWFAPSDLARRARSSGLDGVYLPFFTFDAVTETWYRGERGEHYYETRRFTVMENNKAVEKQETVQRTRWWPTSGTAFLAFDDVLILASKGLPEALVRKLEPWDLADVVPYEEAFLSGFLAECDQRGLKSSFDACKERCQGEIEREIRRDIGGDVQRIQRKKSAWSDVTFKHILLPVWVGAFRYGDKVFRVVVNARTGEVQGERPWSWVKITAAVLAATMVVLVLYAVFGQD